MNFVSYAFLILFGIVLVLYFLSSHRVQNIILLAASLVFYGWWDWRFLGLLLASSGVDFFCGLLIDRERHPARTPRTRKLILGVSVCSNLAILGVFKYFDFFVSSFDMAGKWLGLSFSLPALNLILPVGISFYTFQSMSYGIDVYRNQLRATGSLLDFLLYISFFPQLVAGPIERGTNLLPQVLHPRSVTWEGVCTGAQLILIGYFKKMVIADNLAVIANDVFGRLHPGGLAVILGVYAFAFQIYCDFSGYTDIARGTARILGFNLCLNFRLPYLATNPSDFWQRWHVSLSTWLRDYLYIPLGGNRKGRWQTYRNLSVTMLLGGLWHGASWHFVLWGTYHGLLLVVHRGWTSFHAFTTREFRPRTWSFWIRVLIFFQLTCIGWLIFRATSVGHVAALLATLVHFDRFFEGVTPVMLAQVLLCAVPLMAFQVYQFTTGRQEPWVHWPGWARLVLYVTLFYCIVLFGAPVTNDFIYFQF
jgi:alginate O-acetyltransferase complex protein AlgI